jgi:hypothetical protein
MCYIQIKNYIKVFYYCTSKRAIVNSLNSLTLTHACMCLCVLRSDFKGERTEEYLYRKLF